MTTIIDEKKIKEQALERQIANYETLCSKYQQLCRRAARAAVQMEHDINNVSRQVADLLATAEIMYTHMSQLEYDIKLSIEEICKVRIRPFDQNDIDALVQKYTEGTDKYDPSILRNGMFVLSRVILNPRSNIPRFITSDWNAVSTAEACGDH